MVKGQLDESEALSKLQQLLDTERILKQQAVNKLAEAEEAAVAENQPDEAKEQPEDDETEVIKNTETN